MVKEDIAVSGYHKALSQFWTKQDTNNNKCKRHVHMDAFQNM